MAQISDEAAFCIYQLMLGGIDETQPLRLAALTGVDAFTLTPEFLGRVFVDMQRKYGGYFWSEPAERVRIVPIHAGRLPANTHVALVCAHCDRVCRVVPCHRCAQHGRPPKWVTRTRHLTSAGTHYNGAASAISRASIQYHGNYFDR